MTEQGGMKVKYSVLINLLLGGDSRAKIYSETSNSMVLGIEVLGGYTKFEILQAFDTIIHMTAETSVFGKSKLKWNSMTK